MKVLVACEFSGVVREAFTRRGHIAWSCDLLPTELSGLHYQGNVFDILNENWDLMIAHPPCTMLACSANRWIKTRKPGEIQAALDFAEQLWRAKIPKIAIENPRSILGQRIGKRNQEIHPWQFGHGEKKATWLWLRNLPLLVPTNIVNDREERIWRNFGGKTPDRQKERSRTYAGIASAMALQWG